MIFRQIACVLAYGSIFGATVSTAQATMDPGTRYIGTIVTLRHLTADTTLKFDAQGRVVGKPRPGDWSVDGRVEIVAIEVKTDLIRIRGNRVAHSFEKWEQKHEATLARWKPMKIEVTASSLPIDLERELKKAFLTQGELYPDNLPPYWRPVICELLNQSDCRIGELKPVDPDADPRVKEPLLKKSPLPSYSTVAREARLEGTVELIVLIENTGRARVVSIRRPLGLGLDEIAVKSVEAWTFTPGTLDGKPASTVVAVLMNFSLR